MRLHLRGPGCVFVVGAIVGERGVTRGVVGRVFFVFVRQNAFFAEGVDVIAGYGAGNDEEDTGCAC